MSEIIRGGGDFANISDDPIAGLFHGPTMTTVAASDPPIDFHRHWIAYFERMVHWLPMEKRIMIVRQLHEPLSVGGTECARLPMSVILPFLFLEGRSITGHGGILRDFSKFSECLFHVFYKNLTFTLFLYVCISMRVCMYC